MQSETEAFPGAPQQGLNASFFNSSSIPVQRGTVYVVHGLLEMLRHFRIIAEEGRRPVFPNIVIVLVRELCPLRDVDDTVFLSLAEDLHLTLFPVHVGTIYRADFRDTASSGVQHFDDGLVALGLHHGAHHLHLLLGEGLLYLATDLDTFHFQHRVIGELVIRGSPYEEAGQRPLDLRDMGARVTFHFQCRKQHPQVVRGDVLQVLVDDVQGVQEDVPVGLQRVLGASLHGFGEEEPLEQVLITAVIDDEALLLWCAVVFAQQELQDGLGRVDVFDGHFLLEHIDTEVFKYLF